MTASLAARRRREGEKPPMLVNKDNDGKEQKEKKKTGEGWLKESLLMMAGLIWYSIIGLWKKPSNEDSLKINLSLSKALYTPSHVTIRFEILIFFRSFQEYHRELFILYFTQGDLGKPNVWHRWCAQGDQPGQAVEGGGEGEEASESLNPQYQRNF